MERATNIEKAANEYTDTMQAKLREAEGRLTAEHIKNAFKAGWRAALIDFAERDLINQTVNKSINQ